MTLLTTRDTLITLLEARGLVCTGSGGGLGGVDAEFETPDDRLVYVDITERDLEVRVVLPDTQNEDAHLLAHGTFLTPQAVADFLHTCLQDPQLS